MKLRTNISNVAPESKWFYSLSSHQEERVGERRQNNCPSPRPSPRLGGARENRLNGSRFSQTTRRQHCAGVSLIECLVYIAVFALLMTGGTASSQLQHFP